MANASSKRFSAKSSRCSMRKAEASAKPSSCFQLYCIGSPYGETGEYEPSLLPACTGGTVPRGELVDETKPSPRNREKEGCALAQGRLDPNMPTVGLDDLPAHG